MVERDRGRAAIALVVPLATIAAVMLLFLSKWTTAECTGTSRGWGIRGSFKQIQAVVFCNVTDFGLRGLL